VVGRDRIEVQAIGTMHRVALGRSSLSRVFPFRQSMALSPGGGLSFYPLFKTSLSSKGVKGGEKRGEGWKCVCVVTGEV